jgi:hypothetical protein
MARDCHAFRVIKYIERDYRERTQRAEYWIPNSKVAMDLEGTTADLVTREFLAVVLAGFGNEYAHSNIFDISTHFIKPFSGSFR